MLYTHEIIEFKNDVPIKISIKKLEDIPGHWHKSLEIYFVLSGSIVITAESETYHLSEDDIILINSNQLHEIQSKDSTVVILQLRLSYFKEWMSESAYFQCNSSAAVDKSLYYEIKKIISHLVYINYNCGENNDLIIISLAYRLLHELSKNFKGRDEKLIDTNSKNLKRLRSIIQFLNDNYSDNITLNTIAEREFLSPSYLSHFFEKNMRISIFNYLTEIRMNHAVNDLLTTTCTIEQIAANNGFANSRYFVCSFKKQFGMLPKDYRKEKKKVDVPAISKAMKYSDFLLLEKNGLLNTLGRYLDDNNLGTKSNEICSTVETIDAINVKNQIKVLKHTFKTFTGVGKAREILMQRIQTELKILQKDVGFRYIKFHGILDDSMLLYNEDRLGNPYLTFTYVDDVIDFLLSIGLRPLIQFSFMPKLLAKDPEKTIFYSSSIISEPIDNSKWAFLITNLTKHFIERYGLYEVRTWFFSFWNIPFKSYQFSFENTQIVYELYRITRNCVKECDDLLAFGNPSYTSADFDKNELKNFLDYCQKNNCFPDFYNIHCYPFRTASEDDIAQLTIKENSQMEHTIISDDPDYMAHALELFKKSISEYPKLPIYLTEWASTFSHRDWLNDTCYRSAYIIKSILENYDSVDSFGNWCLSDTLEELPLDNEIFHGELGLFTTSGIKKPAYYSYVFLNKLYDVLIAAGDGYFVTTNQKGDYSIILYNYIPLSSIYAQGMLFNVTFLDRYNVFVDPCSLKFNLPLKQMENGQYIITEQTVNREHGSAFDEWVRMGALPLTTEEEVINLIGRSMPLLTKNKIQISDNSYTYLADLKPHEIKLIKIVKQP